MNFSSQDCEAQVCFACAEWGSGAGDTMAATAVVAISDQQGGEDAALPQRNTLTLPAGARPRQEQPAEVLLFDEARADMPKPYVTSDAEAAEAKRAAAHQREWESRERARAYLVQIRSGDAGTGGEAMLARPHKDIPLAFLSEEVLEAALARQFADSHLIDRAWDAGQLNDWQYAVANRLLQLCDDTGMLSSKVALLGRTGTGHAEMSDKMAAAWKEWRLCMDGVGHPGSELLVDLCLGQLTVRGQAGRMEALRDGLCYLAHRWKIERR